MSKQSNEPVVEQMCQWHDDELSRVKTAARRASSLVSLLHETVRAGGRLRNSSDDLQCNFVWGAKEYASDLVEALELVSCTRYSQARRDEIEHARARMLQLVAWLHVAIVDDSGSVQRWADDDETAASFMSACVDHAEKVRIHLEETIRLTILPDVHSAR